MSTTTSSPADRALRFHGCPKCEKRRKMRVLRPADDTGLEWANCLTCNSILCFEIDEDDLPVNPECVGDFGSPAPEDVRTYAPEEKYEVGEYIYHQTWRDVGRVIRRKDLAGGRAAIDVAFLNCGLKILIVEAALPAR